MRISFNQDYIRFRPNAPLRNTEETFLLLKKGGFDTVDYAMFGYDPTSNLSLRQDYLDQAKNLREFCDGQNMVINQTHLPFYEARPMPDGYVDILLRGVQTSSVLGAKCVVVHADTYYLKEGEKWNENVVLNEIYDVFAPVVELAEKLGVKIAMETLFEHFGSDERRMRYCSKIEELDAIVGKFNCDTVGVCWDFGHTKMAYGNDQFKMIKQLKSKIIATHIHDNAGIYDQHSIPFTSQTNWAEGMQTLAQMGYEGDLTFEIAFGAIPDDLIVDYIKYVRKTGDYLKNLFNSK